MMLLVLLLATALPQNRNLVPGGDGDGTRTVAAESRCSSSGEEVVICREADEDRFRLRKVEPRYVEPPVRAARRLGAGEISVETEQRSFPGAEAPAAMLRFRVPLGRKEPK